MTPESIKTEFGTSSEEQQFYWWLRDCCKLFGCSRDNLDQHVESDLFDLYADGCTAEEAVIEWKAQN